MSRSSPFLWLLLGVIGLAMVLLILRHDTGTVLGLESGQFAQAVILVAILAFVVVGLIGRGAFGRSVRYALAWGALFVVLLVGFTYREELAAVAGRVTSEIFNDGQTTVVQTNGKTEQVVVNRVRGGHFVLVATVNNAPIEMMVDTGASVVTLTPEDARLAGIITRNLDYRVEVQTANGTALAAPVRIDRLAIGPIVRTNVPALVAQPGMLDTSLLGLNFLNSLESFTVSGRQMILTP